MTNAPPWIGKRWRAARKHRHGRGARCSPWHGRCRGRSGSSALAAGRSRWYDCAQNGPVRIEPASGGYKALAPKPGRPNGSEDGHGVNLLRGITPCPLFSWAAQSAHASYHGRFPSLLAGNQAQQLNGTPIFTRDYRGRKALWRVFIVRKNLYRKALVQKNLYNAGRIVQKN